MAFHRSRSLFAGQVVACIIAMGGTAMAAAGESPAFSWTVDDLVAVEAAGAWEISRDGRRAAWIKSRVEPAGEKETIVTHLWLSVLDSAEATEVAPALQLTRGRDRVRSPAFSPDGKHLAFLSNRELPGSGKGGTSEKSARTQVWAISLAGGESFPVTRFDRDVTAFAWTADDRFVVVAEESPSAWELARKEGSDTTQVVDDAKRRPPVRLFAADLEGETRRLTHNRDWIDALTVSPDGTRAVVRAQQSLSYEFDSKVPPHTFVVDLASGAMKRVLAPAEGEKALVPFAPRWALDGSGFYFSTAFSRHPLYDSASITKLHFHDLASGKTVEVDLDWDRGLGRGYEPSADGLIALLADGVRYRPARYLKRGPRWRRQELSGEHATNLDDWILGHDGRTLLYQHSSGTEPPQWYAAKLGDKGWSEDRRLTDLNPSWKAKPKGKVEILHWKGALNETVEGLLFYPLDWPEDPKDAEPRPLIVDIHGGPAGTDRDSWSLRGWPVPGLLWRQQGAFILQVNYHGSAGYGLDWVESIEKRYYELEVPDIEAGVDTVLARGLADPDRLALAGWSNGGILSAEIITRTGRYKAASVGAADVEWISDWANVDFGAAFDNYYFGAPPWEDPQGYIDKSPFFRLTEVTTPAIIYTGTEDRNVPPHQSWSLFRALQQIGKTRARLVLFPGEPHGLRKIAHQRRKIEEDLAWFNEHLFGKPQEDDSAIKKGSLLAGLLAKATAARVGENYGVDAGGVLTPETVRTAKGERGFEIGRFEVTVAQWAAFESGNAPTRPNHPNYPMAGVSFERAREYVEWLSHTIGETYRLPTETEAKKWAGEGGNTLEHWVGYSPNPEDRRRILQALDGLGDAPLLRPVGSFPGKGEDPIFDLDGNAAEWAVKDGAEGIAIGPSADRSNDPRSQAESAPAYVGLRVVKEPGKDS